MATPIPRKRPEDISQYEKWLLASFQVPLRTLRTRYEHNAPRIREQIAASDLWAGLSSSLSELRDLYRVSVNTELPLLSYPDPPELKVKPFASFVDKTFRMNVVWNASFPDPPPEGWADPTNWETWISKVDDVVRTTFVVRHLDGVEFLSDRIVALCEAQGRDTWIHWEAQEKGYYAAQLYVMHQVSVLRPDWEEEVVPLKFEIQVITQLQQVIQALTHPLYERRRSLVTTGGDARNWQWHYENDEFVPNFLGHIVHYVDGMLMEVRKRR